MQLTFLSRYLPGHEFLTSAIFYNVLSERSLHSLFNLIHINHHCLFNEILYYYRVLVGGIRPFVINQSSTCITTIIFFLSSLSKS